MTATQEQQRAAFRFRAAGGSIEVQRFLATATRPAYAADVDEWSIDVAARRLLHRGGQLTESKVFGDAAALARLQTPAAIKAWAAVSTLAEEQLSIYAFRMWLKPYRATQEGAVLVLLGPERLIQWGNRRYHPYLLEHLLSVSDEFRALVIRDELEGNRA